MGKRKAWAELTRRQRREVRAWIRGVLGFWDKQDHWQQFPEALRAALAELREPRRENTR